MRTVIALFAFAGIAAADEPPLVAPPMVSRVARVVIPAPEPAPPTNIFADYPDAKLRAALQPPAQPVARAVRPNVGSCVCNRTGGDCLCQPASLCAQGRCPALTQLRAVEVPYYFPNPTYCPPGRP